MKMVVACLLAVVYFATICFAGVHVWSRSIVILSVLATFLVGLMFWLAGSRRKPRRSCSILFDPPSLVGIFFVAFVAIQVVPISPSLLRFISPQGFALWKATGILGGEVPSFISLYPFMTVNGLMLVLSVLFFYWIALYGLKTRKQIQVVVAGLLLLGVFEGLYGMVQSVSGEPHILWWKKLYYQEVASGTFINRNHLAAFLSMVICLGVGYAWSLKRPVRNGTPRRGTLVHAVERWGTIYGMKAVCIFLGIAVMLAALLVSASRGGALSLLVGLIFMMGLIIARFFKSRNAFSLVLILSVICMYVGYTAADRVLARFDYIDSSFQERLERSKATWEMGTDFPFTGTGMGTYEFVYPAYKKERAPKVVYAHNDWVQLFAETGWPGFVLVLGGLLVFLVLGVMQWRKRHDPFSVGIGLGGLGALVTISIHSLSDFNLHMPANALTLALIVAVTYLSLYSYRHRGEEYFDYPKNTTMRISLVPGILLLLIAALGSGIIATHVIRVWRADSLARIFWNSTIPSTDSTNQELEQAWRLVPGNAEYWASIGNRVFAHPGEKKDYDIHLWSEGIKRNPTAWRIWRELGWGAFARQREDPNQYLSLAEKALGQASRLSPYSARGYLEEGSVALACDALCREENRPSAWREAFRKALDLDPSLAPKVADQLILYRGSEGAGEMKGLLPADSTSYHLAARYLLGGGHLAAGIDILKAAESIKQTEINRLLAEYNKYGRWSRKEGGKVLRNVLALDPSNPPALMLKGEILEALVGCERRGKRLESLNDRKDTAWTLRKLREAKQGDPALIAYFLGRIAELENNIEEAEREYRRALYFNSQYFPALIRLRDVLRSRARTTGDHIEMERLEKKISLFAMDRITPDLWKSSGTVQGLPSWKAPFRIAAPINGFKINFSGNEAGAWKLTLDGRFVAAWAGGTWVKKTPLSVPAGEHEFRLVYYGAVVPPEKGKTPFTLRIQFEGM